MCSRLLLPFFQYLDFVYMYLHPHLSLNLTLLPSSITISSCPLFSRPISTRLTLSCVTSGEQPLHGTADWKQAPVHLPESGTHLTEIFVKKQITWLRLLLRAAAAVWGSRNIPPASTAELRSRREATWETEWWNAASPHRHLCKIIVVSQLQIRLLTLDAKYKCTGFVSVVKNFLFFWKRVSEHWHVLYSL